MSLRLERFVSKKRLAAFIRLQTIEHERCRKAAAIFTEACKQFSWRRLTLDLERSRVDNLDLHLVTFF